MVHQNLSETPLIEFSRRHLVADLALQPDRTTKIQARADECQKLATRLGLPEIKSFWADIGMKPNPSGGGYICNLTLNAHVVYTSVISLSPVPGEVNDKITCELWSHGSILPDAFEEDDTQPDIEILDAEGFIDFGELATQYLSLALDPYPRGVGEAFTTETSASAEQIPPQRVFLPFAELSETLKNNKKSFDT